MTKHRLICAVGLERFPHIQKLIEEGEELGWQAIPSTLKFNIDYVAILMFKVESNSPYRTQVSNPSNSISPLKGIHETFP